MTSVKTDKEAWSWTVEDVIANVCHSSELFYATGCRPEGLPDTVALEAQLRDQEVDGATFLTAITLTTLRSEFQIHSLGQRTALLAVIELLRQQSPRYRQHAATTGVGAPQIADNPAMESVDNGGPLGPPATRDASGKKRQKTVLVTAAAPSASTQAPSITSALFATPHAEQIAEGSGSWDHLLHWEHDDDRVVGNEDVEMIEEEEDELDEHEMEERPGSLEPEDDVSIQKPGESKFSCEEIANIINDQIEHYTNAWKPNHGVLKEDEIEYDPEAMWQKAYETNQLKHFIQKYETDAAYYRQRLDSLCENIMKFPGTTAEKIRYQCRNLEVTVHSLELSQWLLSIYSLAPVVTSDNEEEAQVFDNERYQMDTDASSRHLNRNIRAPTNHKIIDLDSPSGSSHSGMDGVVYSSPSPGLPTEEGRHGPNDDIHFPYSNIVETIELPMQKTPLRRQTAEETATIQPRLQIGDEPQHASIASARRWEWGDLIDTRDRKRIVTKALHELREEDREMIRSRLGAVGKTEMTREIHACIRMFVKDENKIPGILPRDKVKVVTFTNLFLCWWFCENYFSPDTPKRDLEPLHQYLEQGLPDIVTFCNYLNIIMATTFSPEALRNPERPSQAEIIEISDDDEPLPPRQTTVQTGSRPHGPQATQSPTIVID